MRTICGFTILALCLSLPVGASIPAPRCVHFSGAAFTPNLDFLAAGNEDDGVEIIDLASGQRLRVLTGHERMVSSVVLTPDGKTVVSAGRDGTIRLWDLSSGRELKTLQGYDRKIRELAMSPGGKSFVSSGNQGTTEVWDVHTGRRLTGIPLQNPARSMAFSPDGRLLACSTGKGGVASVTLWNPSTGDKVLEIPESVGGKASTASGLAFSPDGKILAAAMETCVRLWRVKDGKLVATLDVPEEEGAVRLAFSPDGKTLASGGVEAGLRLWDVEKREPKWTSPLKGEVGRIAFHADGGSLAAVTDTRNIHVWEAGTGVEVRSFTSR